MYSQIAQNKAKSFILIASFIGITLALGWLLSLYFANEFIIIAFGAVGVIQSIVAYYASDKIALRYAHAHKIEKKDAPALYRMIENLAITSGLPMPRVYISPDPAPNAFATGRDPKHAVVCVNQGLIDMLEDEELEGVLAHEMSHIGNYDIRVMAIVMALASVITTISNFFLHISMFGGDSENRPSNPAILILGLAASLLAPLAATLIQLAVSRRREYLADASGALLTRYPDGLARALAKISSYKHPDATANTATAHMYFSNPFKGKGGGMIAKLFSTHPPAEDRIARLREMEGKV